MYIVPIRPTPDPELGGYLADAGRVVDASPYWLRRLRDGDVRQAEPPAPPPPPGAAADPDSEPADAGSSVSTRPAIRSRKGS